MKQNIELLLKDLCARLPYNVKVKIPSIESPLTILSINTNGVTWVKRDTGYPFEIDWENCKPYLFPFSSMGPAEYVEFVDLGDETSNDCFGSFNFKQLDWLNAHHFDYRRLIKKGLALDATELNIY